MAIDSFHQACRWRLEDSGKLMKIEMLQRHFGSLSLLNRNEGQSVPKEPTHSCLHRSRRVVCVQPGSHGKSSADARGGQSFPVPWQEARGIGAREMGGSGSTRAGNVQGNTFDDLARRLLMSPKLVVTYIVTGLQALCARHCAHAANATVRPMKRYAIYLLSGCRSFHPFVLTKPSVTRGRPLQNR